MPESPGSDSEVTGSSSGSTLVSNIQGSISSTGGEEGASSPNLNDAKPTAPTAIEPRKAEVDEKKAPGSNKNDGDGDAKRAKDAIIYIPGIDHGRTAHDIASRLAAALDVLSPKHKKDFIAAIAKPTILPYGSNMQEFQSQVSQIRLKEKQTGDDGKEEEKTECIADVYCFDYHENLTEEWNDAELFRKVWLMFLTIAIYSYLTFRVIVTKVTRGKIWHLWDKLLRCICCNEKDQERYKTAQSVGIMDVLQFSYLTFILFLIVLYFAFLIIAAIEAVRVIVKQSRNETADPADSFIPYSQQMYIFASLLGFGCTTSFKKAIVSIATDYTTCLQYLMFGSQMQELQGQLVRLIEETRREGEYDRIHLVGYSFGSLIAIDALYPLGGDRPNQFQKLEHFVTVACPFDMVRAYLPSYYSNLRTLKPKDPEAHPQDSNKSFTWTNIFVPADIFASNFSEKSKSAFAIEGTPEIPNVNVFGEMKVAPNSNDDKGIPDKNVAHYISPNANLQLWSCLFAAGLSSHGQCWDNEPSGADVSKEIAEAVFRGHDFLKEGFKESN